MELKIEKLDQTEVLEILKTSDCQFSPPLSTVVELEAYSLKLSSKAFFSIATEGSDTCGVVAYYLNDSINQIYIPYVFVYEPFRNRHLATRLIEYIIQSNKKYTSVALEVVKTNQAALNLYRNMHFEIKENREHTYLMWLDLN